MKNYTQTIIWSAISVVIVAGLVGLFVYNYHSNAPKITYQPVDACKLLTPAKAEKLLGDRVNNINTTKAAINADKVTANSQCAYTDVNPNQTQMKETVIAVQSAINSEGVTKNNTVFDAKQKSTANAQVVTGIGDKAFYDQSLGQLNVLDGHKWVIISYGAGGDPSTMTLANDTELAKIVLK